MQRAMVGTLAAVLLLPAGVAAQDGSPGPSPAATAEPSRGEPSSGQPRIQWASDAIELTADDLRLRVGDRVVTAPREVLAMGQTYHDHAQLEAWWYEKGSQQRLNINLDLDDTRWWVDSVWAYDAHGRQGEWVYFEDLAKRTRTPLGESYTGDLRLESTDADREAFRRAGSAVLRLDGLRLSAFLPGTRPAALTGCDYLVDDRVQVIWKAYEHGNGGGFWRFGYSDGILQGPGELLEGVEDMTPKEVEAALQGAGLCYRFDHSWRPTPRFEDPRLDRDARDRLRPPLQRPRDRRGHRALVRTRLPVGWARGHRLRPGPRDAGAGLAGAATVRHGLPVAVAWPGRAPRAPVRPPHTISRPARPIG